MLCVREGIFPLYFGATVAFVPNAIFDLMFYSEEIGPICLSMKTSLRERYKQAAMEGVALKDVHRRARSYLITLNANEANNVNEKIDNGDVVGLDKVLIATQKEFDDLFKELGAFTFVEAPVVNVISSNLVVTKQKFENL